MTCSRHNDIHAKTCNRMTTIKKEVRLPAKVMLDHACVLLCFEKILFLTSSSSLNLQVSNTIYTSQIARGQPNAQPMERRTVTSVTMAALLLDENKTHDDGDDKENGKKVIGFYYQNNNFARASRYFVHFFAVVAPLRHKTS